MRSCSPAYRLSESTSLKRKRTPDRPSLALQACYKPYPRWRLSSCGWFTRRYHLSDFIRGQKGWRRAVRCATDQVQMIEPARHDQSPPIPQGPSRPGHERWDKVRLARTRWALWPSNGSQCVQPSASLEDAEDSSVLPFGRVEKGQPIDGRSRPLGDTSRCRRCHQAARAVTRPGVTDPGPVRPGRELRPGHGPATRRAHRSGRATRSSTCCRSSPIPITLIPAPQRAPMASPYRSATSECMSEWAGLIP